MRVVNNYHIDGYMLVTSHVADARHAVAFLVLEHHAPRRRFVTGHRNRSRVLGARVKFFFLVVYTFFCQKNAPIMNNKKCFS